MTGSARVMPRLSPPVALGWSILLTVGLTAVGVMIGRLLGATSATLLALSVVEVLIYGSAAVALGRFYVGPDRGEALALGRAGALELLLAVSLGVVLHLPAGYLDALIEQRFPTPRERMLEQLQQLTPLSPAHAAGLLLGIAVLAPLAEELFFRGSLFTALQRTSPGFVVSWTTSIAFVLAHQEPRMWAPVLLVALVLSELRRASGSLWPGFALHAAFNATTLLTVFNARPQDLEAPHVSWSLGLGGGALCAVGVWVFRRAARTRLGRGVT